MNGITIADSLRQRQGTWWRSRDTRFLKRHYGTMSSDDIGLLLGRSALACDIKASKLKLIPIKEGAAKPNGRAKKIILQVATEIGCSPSALLGRCKKRDLAIGRWRVASELRKAGYSFPKIGQQLGLHHTTILYGLRHLPVYQAQREATEL